jgi:hypothetical protein
VKKHARSGLWLSLCCLSALAFAQAAPPPNKGPGEDKRALSGTRAQRAMRMMAMVGIAEALDLSDAEALKVAESFKTFEERRAPIRLTMGQAMRNIKLAADGDTAAQAQVDANVKVVLEGRAQMAQLDRDLFQTLAVGQSAQRKAKLAVFIANFGQEMQKLKQLKERRGPPHKRAQE